ncbi:MAG: CHASE2 domain-containing protein, partial [Hyphomicrobiales bacterium]|nr:CHASE2 domain-containing protein [Hyphomicrobiales bacterium]
MKRGFDRKKALVAAGLTVLGVLFAVLGPRHVQFLASAENWVTDLRVATLTPDTGELHPDIVVLEITEADLAKLPYRSPLDRGFLANLVQAMAGAGARAMGLDILFDQATESDKDARLQQVLRDAPMPVVVGWTDRETGLTEAQYAFQQKFLEGIRAGYSNLRTDAVDLTVRSIFPGRVDPDGNGDFHLGWAAAIAQAVGVTPPRAPVRLVYRGWGKGKLGFRSFDASAALALARFKKDWFQDKIILVGANLPFEDRHRTPFSAVYGGREGTLAGIYVQANSLAQMLDGRAPPTGRLGLEVAIVAVLSLLALVLTFVEMPWPIKAPSG